MSAARSQNDRVLRVLQARGKTGLTQLDFIAPVIDGGAPILRLPSRVDELRRRGHPIRTEMVKVGRARVARYRLDADAGEQVATGSHLRTGRQVALSQDERRASELRMTGHPPEGYGFAGFEPESAASGEQAALDLGKTDRRPLSPYDPKAEA